MTVGFDALHPALRYHIVNTLGWPDLRPTQADAIGPVMLGENVLLLAPTAGGKTEAAVFPLLTRIAVAGWPGPAALYVCPLKALLNNIAPRLELYAGFLGLRIGLWHGDIGASARRRMLRDRPAVILTTPESLEAMMISPRVDHVDFLGAVRALVVDELHAFAGDDRGWHLQFLTARLERLCGRTIQRIGLTATVGNPEDMLHWFSSGRGGRVIGPAQAPTDGQVTADHVGSIENALTVISRLYPGERRLVFADSRSMVERIASGLRHAGVRTFVSHASLSLDQRRQAEAAFAAEPDCVIVATSTLELGLDVGDLDRVIQVGASPSVASFLQRMGRTGRRPGSTRNFLFLSTRDQELLTCLALTNLWRDGSVEAVTAPVRPAHIFAQQVMALALQTGGLARVELERWLGDSVDAVASADRATVLEHMLANGILAENDGVLGMGVRGEREFGRRHFADLLASFTQPLLLGVRHGPTDLGSVHPVSLAPLSRNQSPILSLAGRSWKVLDVDWRRRLVSVAPSEGGGISRWLGSGRGLTASVCRAAERIVAGTPPACRLSRRAETALGAIRSRLAFVDAERLPIVADGRGRVTVWTFSGSVASSTVARELASSGPALASFDDLSVSLRGTSVREVADRVRRIDPELARPHLPDDLAGALKFGLCLPEALVAAVLSSRISDPDAVREVVTRRPRLVSDTLTSCTGQA